MCCIIMCQHCQVCRDVLAKGSNAEIAMVRVSFASWVA